MKRSFSACVPTVTRSAPGRPERAAGAHEHAALGELLDDLGLVLADVEPDEVRVRLGDAQPEPLELDDQRGPLGEVALDAAGHLVLVLERLDRRGLGGRVAEERLADLVDRGAERLRAAQRVAHAQAAEPVDLRERPQQHEVRVLGEQLDRVLGVLQQRELDVGLVEDHGDVARDPRDERRDLGERQRRRGRVVRVADDHEPRRAGDLRPPSRRGRGGASSSSGTSIARAPEAAARCG